MTKIILRAFGVLYLSLTLEAPIGARSDDTTIIVRHINTHPSTTAETKRTLARLDDAALRACGGSGFSLREVKAALRESACWKDAMDGAVRQIASPALQQNLARKHAAR